MDIAIQRILISVLAIAAAPAVAQETLPEGFFIGCKPKDWSEHILLFADRIEWKISMTILIFL